MLGDFDIPMAISVGFNHGTEETGWCRQFFQLPDIVGKTVKMDEGFGRSMQGLPRKRV